MCYTVHGFWASGELCVGLRAFTLLCCRSRPVGHIEHANTFSRSIRPCKALFFARCLDTFPNTLKILVGALCRSANFPQRTFVVLILRGPPKCGPRSFGPNPAPSPPTLRRPRPPSPSSPPSPSNPPPSTNPNKGCPECLAKHDSKGRNRVEL